MSVDELVSAGVVALVLVDVAAGSVTVELEAFESVTVELEAFESVTVELELSASATVEFELLLPFASPAAVFLPAPLPPLPFFLPLPFLPLPLPFLPFLFPFLLVADVVELVAVEHVVSESEQSSTDVELEEEDDTIDVVLEHALLSMIVELAEETQGDSTAVELALLELESALVSWFWFWRGAARAPRPIRTARKKREQEFDNILDLRGQFQV